MGNNFSINQKEDIFNKLILEYEKLNSLKLDKKDIFTKINRKFNQLTQTEIEPLDLMGIDLSNVDGIIKTDDFTLIGWNDNKEDIDLEGLAETIKQNKNREDK